MGFDRHPALDTTAHHEAGHACAAVALGLTVVSVDVEHTVRRFGCCYAPHDHLPIDVQATYLLAGPAAERRHRGTSYAGDAGDMEDVSELFRNTPLDVDRPFLDQPAYAGAMRQRMLDDWYARATALVDTHWDWIGRVAKALMARRELNGLEVKNLKALPVVRITRFASHGPIENRGGKMLYHSDAAVSDLQTSFRAFTKAVR